MGVFEMVVIVVVAGCLTGVATEYFKSRANNGVGSEAAGDIDALKARAAASDAELEKLRDRVRVLEKLVVDDDHRLAKEIDGLRSSPRA